MTRPTWATALIILLALVPGASAASGAGAGADPVARTSAGVASNATDAAFAAGMAAHHTGGVDLGRMAARKGAQPAVRRLGAAIAAVQSRELVTLRSLLRRYGAEEPAVPKPIEDRDARTMRALGAASGAEFDRLWLEEISGHHVAAVQMAQIERAGGADPQAIRLARGIISTQLRELRAFNRLIAAAD